MNFGKRLAFHLRYAPGVSQSADKITDRPGAGLCDQCLHARCIESDRGSVFYLCELSVSDPRFPKYPRLPILTCDGFEKKP